MMQSMLKYIQKQGALPYPHINFLQGGTPMAAPLADRIRPQSLDEMVGQQHLLGPNGLLRRIAQSGSLPNLIFYGPSGVGKTTAARIIAAGAGKKLYRLNGTTASTGDIKALIADLGGFDAMDGVVLYLDEIQYLNKKQQ